VQDGLEALYLMEIERRNLLTYSEDFSEGAWRTLGASLTANAAMDPFGRGMYATKLVDAVGSDTNRLYYDGYGQGTVTLSIYAKAAEYSQLRLFFYNPTDGTRDQVVFQLSDGSIISGTSGGVEDAGNGWWRCWTTSTSTASDRIRIELEETGQDGTSGIYVYGAQINDGTSPLPYVPTSNKRAVYDYSGNGNHAHLGSEGVAFINPVGGAKALNLPGTTGNYASTPDSAAVSLTGGLQIDVDATLDWGGNGNPQTFIDKILRYRFLIDGGGALKFQRTESGSLPSLTVDPGWSGVSRRQVRCTYNDTTGEVAFYELDEAGNATLIGNGSITAGGLETIVGDLQVGARYDNLGSWVIDGQVHRAQLYDGIDGTLVADFNPEDAHGDVTQFYSTTTGELWTINQSAATTNDPTWTGEGLDFDGVDDYVTYPEELT